jgi:hypothetical protein
MSHCPWPLSHFNDDPEFIGSSTGFLPKTVKCVLKNVFKNKVP